ncbi:UDP-Glycosyltransferase/glycogen phosphorylase [Sodiomyces alkalinus F11]|uniref:UDP-Glycosyltransferase/glycogen phosphorylase n=1 Tax=Sodiomyces alkalinus (strain CBS 110278 / VKM F-3762 / F11) TaxID=1314773 RepID=A0A3N2Q3F2_SODAK|nr:UDP-Glycosyltransferase/glycogen phosphorylase [Sodiomyces alkalinus F11]ROT41272.1 UDP-Glycosyltransferase/glycogen phosphorylase [Sodiomyces alkalinus F11]
MTPPKKILMITNSETGQSNVILATAHALFEQDPTVQVHIASFPQLEPAAKKALAHVQDGRFAFHALPGPAFSEVYNRDPDPANTLLHGSLVKPSIASTPHLTRFFLAKLFYTWTTEEFVALFDAARDLIEKTVRPDICVVEGYLTPALTAMMHVHAHAHAHRFRATVMLPTSLKDVAGHLEPGTAMLTKWPVVGSALPMPIPWYYVPLNAYFFVRMVLVLVRDETPARYEAAVRAATGIPDLDVLSYGAVVSHPTAFGVERIFVGSRAEVDFPQLDLESPPRGYMERVVACGPILRASPALREVDPELAAWMGGEPVVYVNLGTMCRVSEDEAVDMARALKQVLDVAGTNMKTKHGAACAEPERRGQEMRVLWKIKKDPTRGPPYGTGPGSKVYDVFREEMEADPPRVRISEWLDAEPMAILSTGDAVCAVTHGGANSFYEAIAAGVPQVVLPVWGDTYDYANRAELLGIGRWGSRKGCPRWYVSELAPVLAEVVLERNAEFAAKSRALAEVCRRDGGGRNVAARKILALAEEK